MSITAQVILCVGVVLLSLPLRIVDVLLLRFLRYSLNLLLVLISTSVSAALLVPSLYGWLLQTTARLLDLADLAVEAHELVVGRQLNAGALLSATSLLVVVIRPVCAGLQAWEERRRFYCRPWPEKQVPLSSLIQGK
jgi:type III secretory pathway component EscV